MTVDPTIGIDLGTTNSVVAACDSTGEPRVLPDARDETIHPSVVSFHPNGSVIAGPVAKQRRVIDPNNTVYSIKRLIGRPYSAPEVQAAMARMPFAILEGENQQPVIRTRGGQFAIPELSAIVLDHMRVIASRALRAEIERAVITVPANFNEGQRAATATAGAIAGLEVAQIINEPTAAALAYGHRKRLDQVIAVYDFGGGTFDISILKLEDNVYEVLATAGNSFLGGDDIDETLVDSMVETFLRQRSIDLRSDDLAMQRLRAVAEQIKIQLSRRARAIVKIDAIAYGPGGRGLDLELEITREELVNRCAHVVEQTFPVCDEALSLAQLDRARITDVVLVGGTTKMPYIRDRATRYFGTQPRVDVNPDEAVALGAALQADILARQLAGISVEPRSGTASQTTLTRIDTGADSRVAAAIQRSERRRRSAASSSVRVEHGADDSDLYLTLDDSEVTEADALEPPDFSRRDTLRGVGKRDAPSGRRTLPGPLPGPDRPDDTVDDDPPSASTLFEPPAAAHAELPPPSGRDVDTRSETIPRAPRAAPPPPPGAAPAEPTMLAASPVPAEPIAGFGVGDQPGPPPPVDPSKPIAHLAPAPPTIRDVTPYTLGIGTIAGFCEPIIARNTRIPAETTKRFSTSKDGQRTVRLMVFQGESRRLGDNTRLGDLVLDNLPPRARGQTTIEVRFSINASGMLEIFATDVQTGAQQSASVELLGAQRPDEIAASQDRMRQLMG